MKIAKDHPATVEYALQAGKLLQNFGVVELTTYRWINWLSGSAIATEISKELTLSKRIEVILKLVAREPRLRAEDTQRAVTIWKEIKEKGCEIRNAVAHGTVGLSFPNSDTSLEPTQVGILKLQKWRDSHELLSIEEVKGAVNTTSKFAEELAIMLDRYGAS